MAKSQKTQIPSWKELFSITKKFFLVVLFAHIAWEWDVIRDWSRGPAADFLQDPTWYPRCKCPFLNMLWMVFTVQAFRLERAPCLERAAMLSLVLTFSLALGVRYFDPIILLLVAVATAAAAPDA
ncbi:MAG: hypothetical protein CMK36_07570 [Porticoccaceae bacterium]|mgnify:CR=1 FL=1|nr:hypothetical protein [Porticoccaceae bacterium]|tara:strand:+ start:4707 stop:5081 length:375 start_codon:yes stop_codon:yes gene_type:complete